MIKPIAIDHVCLFVSSLEETKSYLEKLFNFECRYRDEFRKTLVVESDSVRFFVEEFVDKKGIVEKQHISFQVKSLSNIVFELERNEIVDYQIGEVDFFKNRNYKWCEWTDENGIRFECVEVK